MTLGSQTVEVQQITAAAQQMKTHFSPGDKIKIVLAPKIQLSDEFWLTMKSHSALI